MAVTESALIGFRPGHYKDFEGEMANRNGDSLAANSLVGELLVSDFAYSQGISARDALKLRRVDANTSSRKKEVMLGAVDGKVPVVLHYDCEDLVPVSKDESDRCDQEIQGIVLFRPEHEWHEAFCKLDPRLRFFAFSIPGKPFMGNTASWRDIEIVDSYGTIFYPDSGYPGARVATWIPDTLKNMNPELPGMRHFRRTKNAAAVRERKLLFSKLLSERMMVNQQADSKTNILSLAAGSGRTNFYALMQAEQMYGVDPAEVSIHNIDMDPRAKDYCMALAGVDGFNVKATVEYDIENVMKLAKVINGRKYTDVNFEGLADYFDDKGKAYLLKSVRSSMVSGGKILMSNVFPNSEMDPFLHRVIGWEPMYYTDVAGLVRVARMAGFDDQDIKVHVIPTGMYGVLELTQS